MAREKDAEIAFLKQRIKELTNQVKQQWKQKQSESTIFDSMSDAQLHEITQQGRATIEKRRHAEIMSRSCQQSTYIRPLLKKVWKFCAQEQCTTSFDSESERLVHELTQKFGVKKDEEEKKKEVSHQVDSKKRKAKIDVNERAKDPGQAQPTKKRKLLKTGPVFKYLSKESNKKLTSFWKSAAETDSLWAGNHYETSIYADEVGHILEQEAIANSYVEAKANETTRRKMYDDDLNNVLTFDFVIFPIHEDDHWTLLVLKVLEGS
ncbi:hypothetical protein RHMOL_Rhmol06G0013500 [Rhododendron molle]|uniref:Uncharacterized protein n=1 Tax=Rhododendron molle TaxID=49168 RepID=A0ACC0N7Z2_RHOML|nr:hypothetical protein RHMOL_Rhmol06G0013500 [Rhododendron molle]